MAHYYPYSTGLCPVTPSHLPSQLQSISLHPSYPQCLLCSFWDLESNFLFFFPRALFICSKSVASCIPLNGHPSTCRRKFFSVLPLPRYWIICYSIAFSLYLKLSCFCFRDRRSTYSLVKVELGPSFQSNRSWNLRLLWKIPFTFCLLCSLWESGLVSRTRTPHWFSPWAWLPYLLCGIHTLTDSTQRPSYPMLINWNPS